MAAVRTWVLVLSAALGLGACKRPSPQACEEAIRNWYTLVYWEEAEKQIAAAPPEQRDELRKQKLAKHDKDIEAGIEQAIMDCRSSRDFDGVKCMKEATTGAQARQCREPKKPD
ncbi:MAG TPA: hypothetical protein VM734_06865 [Kofleriaceae bacterium]|nr:hypothetical protein [Kofleriaceae bacterium]